MSSIKDKTAICGVGNTSFGFPLNRSPLDLMAEALENAAKDAGIGIRDIDGLISTSGAPYAADSDSLAQILGLELKMYSQTWTHGRFTGTGIQHAAMTVASGMVDTVAVMGCLALSGVQAGLQKNSSKPPNVYEEEAWTSENAREGGGGHGEDAVYGIDSTETGVAMLCNRYFERYGATSEKMAAVPMAMRRHGSLNPLSMVYNKPLTLEDYMDSSVIAAPMREPDYPIVAEGSGCLIITSTERAKDMAKPPVLISGMQPLPVGRQQYIWGYPGMGMAYQDEFDYDAGVQPVYKMADIEQSAVDALYTYDGFSMLVWMALERWGFCKPGEAADFTQNGRIEIDGELPVNSNGGLMGEAHIMAYNTHAEMVRQIRGECGERQLKNAEVLQWANAFGDSLIYRGL